MDLNAYRIVLCMIAVQSGVLGLYILVLPSFHEGCIQQWSGNGKCIFRNKIEKFCCNFNFYFDKYSPFPDQESPPLPPRRFSTRGVFSATKIMKVVY